jgi:hypothetical protein
VTLTSTCRWVDRPAHSWQPSLRRKIEGVSGSGGKDAEHFMGHRGVKSPASLLCSGLVLAVMALTACLASPSAAAEFCPTGVVGTSASCEAALDLAQDLARRRKDRVLNADPANDRIRRLDNAGAAASSDLAMPFAVSGEDGRVNFDTSLTQWGSALSVADAKNLTDAQAAMGENAALPKSGRPRAANFDVWAQARNERFSNTGAKQGGALTTTIGADYRFDRNLLFGGMVQIDDAHQTVFAAADATSGTAYMAGPYIAYRLTAHMTVDAKAAWGTAFDNVSAGSENLSLATNRMLTEARLTGNWGWNAWQINQTGAITYFDEAGRAALRAPGSSSEVARLSIGPELKRHMETGGGTSVEPFAFFKSSLDLDDAAWAGLAGQNTVGGGLLLGKPDKYKIRAAADYSESVSGNNQVATGKVSVSVPASLLGF